MAKKDTRRFTIEVTAQEVALMVRAHTSLVRKITTLAGKEALKIRQETKGKGQREVGYLLGHAETMVNEHLARAKELQALLKP